MQENDLFNKALLLFKEMGTLSVPMLMRKFNLNIFAAEELREKVMKHAKYHKTN